MEGREEKGSRSRSRVLELQPKSEQNESGMKGEVLI